MANHITYDARPDLPRLLMSNMTTWGFMEALALAASSLATTDRHRQFAAWIASNDQSIFGLGMVGFDMAETPWSVPTFEEDRAFLLRAVDRARAGTAWGDQSYVPSALDQYRLMLLAFDVAQVVPDHERTWTYGGKPSTWSTCPVHAIYNHAHGCIICTGED